MDKKEKEKIEKEIEYWSKHLELDKFNYGMALSVFIFNLTIAISIIMGLSTIIMALNLSSNLKLITILLIWIGFIFYLEYIKKTYKNINQQNLSFFVRERMIQERYKKLNLGISKNNLNQEFGDIKNICKYPTRILKENLIKQYYKEKDAE